MELINDLLVLFFIPYTFAHVFIIMKIGWVEGLAALLVFSGVYIVTQSKSRAQVLLKEKKLANEGE